MPPGLLPWIVLPLVGALIGYGTNRLAVKMIFRPLAPVRVLGLRVQGLVPRRQPDLAASVGRVVGDHLVTHEDFSAALAGLDLRSLVERAFDAGLGPKIAELRAMPLVGGFLTEERIAEWRAAAARGVEERREEVLGGLEDAALEGLDVRAIVERKVAAFPAERLEGIVLDVAARELRAIELLGGLLGALIGLAQAGLLAALA